MKRLLQYGKGYGRQAVLAPLFKMLEASFELFVPLVVAAVIDTGIRRQDIGYILRMRGLLVLLAGLARPLGNGIPAIAVLLFALSVLAAFESPTVQACVPQMLAGEALLRGLGFPFKK